MTLQRPLAEITDEALTLLYRELGVVDTVRFSGQYGAGYGDYTKEREALFADLTLEEVADEVQGRSWTAGVRQKITD